MECTIQLTDIQPVLLDLLPEGLRPLPHVVGGPLDGPEVVLRLSHHGVRLRPQLVAHLDGVGGDGDEGGDVARLLGRGGAAVAEVHVAGLGDLEGEKYWAQYLAVNSICRA